MNPYKIFLILLISGQVICSNRANGVEYQPWLGNPYEFEARFSLHYQGFGSVASGSHLERYSSDDIFLNFSLRNANPDPAVAFEFEVTQARTRNQH